MKKPQSTVCIAAVGSLTLSLKAQRILQEAGLTARVVSLLREETRQGCAYGVSFSCDEKPLVKATLSTQRLTPTQYIERKGTP